MVDDASSDGSWSFLSDLAAAMHAMGEVRALSTPPVEFARLEDAVRTEIIMDVVYLRRAQRYGDKGTCFVVTAK